MFKWLADYGRLLRAATALVKHDVILPGAFQSRLPVPAKVAGKVLRLFGGGARGRPGKRLATALEKLGPAYIKLGQFLATRPDVFGTKITEDLDRLKDKLPAFSAKVARAALVVEFGETESSDLFPDLGDSVAAASLAQVHKVQFGDEVKAVKILRPGIEASLQKELRAMKRAAKTAEGVSEEGRRMKAVAFVDTVSSAMMRETDLRLEAGGADELREVGESDGHFVIPHVDWARTGQRVLTTDWVFGTPLTDPHALDGDHIDRPKLALAITQGFLSHAIKHGVFHADMHEGNIIITPEGKVALVDFGVVGRIDDRERRFLAEILWGFIKRDYVRIAEVHFEAGYVPETQSVGDFAQALRSIGEPLHGKTADEMSMGRVLLQLFDYTQTFGMQMRPELVLLQKTMAQVEGVARNIDPSLNIWDAAEPIVREWVQRSFGPEGAARLVAGNARKVADRLKRLPDIMDQLEQKLAEPAHPAMIQRERVAPWWAWFGLVIILAALASATAIVIS